MGMPTSGSDLGCKGACARPRDFCGTRERPTRGHAAGHNGPGARAPVTLLASWPVHESGPRVPWDGRCLVAHHRLRRSHRAARLGLVREREVRRRTRDFELQRGSGRRARALRRGAHHPRRRGQRGAVPWRIRGRESPVSGACRRPRDGHRYAHRAAHARAHVVRAGGVDHRGGAGLGAQASDHRGRCNPTRRGDRRADCAGTHRGGRVGVRHRGPA